MASSSERAASSGPGLWTKESTSLTRAVRRTRPWRRPRFGGFGGASHQGRAFGWLSSSLTDSGLEGKEYVDMVGEEEAMGLERDEKKESWIGTI